MPEEKGSFQISRGKSGMVADCDLFATRDGRLVTADDPEANMLVAREGMPIPESLVDSLGIKAGRGGKVDQDLAEANAAPSVAADEPKADEPKAAQDDDKVLTTKSIKRG